MTSPRPRGLYAISHETDDTPALLAWTLAVIEGGAIWLQYRDKSADQRRRNEQAMALATLCRRLGVRFLINDDVELARSCAADGVHLGAEDMTVERARKRLGASALIGASCYDDPDRGAAMAAAGADYLAFGAFFSTASKPDARRAAPAQLQQARALNLPLVAIGGITPDNGAALIRAGADLLAVIGGLSGPPARARAAARHYAELFESQELGEPDDAEPLPVRPRL